MERVEASPKRVQRFISVTEAKILDRLRQIQKSWPGSIVIVRFTNSNIILHLVKGEIINRD